MIYDTCFNTCEFDRAQLRADSAAGLVPNATRPAGLHSFDEVVDDLLVAAAGTRPSSGMTA